jgi:predicted nucleic acid-binding protein
MNFFDSHVLLYAEDGRFEDKQQIARDLLREGFSSGSGVISAQVLEEFYANAIRKLGASRADARDRARHYSALLVVPVTAELALAAIDFHQLTQIAFWDALIVKAAASSGCGTLYSEDLKDGATYDGVRVRNPFVAPPTA